MRILVVGGGAREHALAWKLKQSPVVDALFVAPGNAGTAQIATNLPIAVNDFSGLISASQANQIDLTVVGPEDPLAAGLADAFSAQGLTIFGPVAAAARIESSKAWAKEVMTAAGVPTATSLRFSDLASALDAVFDAPLPIVIKADGLAAGKGVIIAETRRDAEEAVRSMLSDGAFGQAGREILIEEFLAGREVSVLALTDGETIVPLVPACDYKRALDGDLGLNTGGMGAYTPVPQVGREMLERIQRQILEPTIAELRARGIVYRGVLYAGLVLTNTGPKVIEFNCRFGDPETEVVLPLMATDLAELLLACAEGRLSELAAPEWDSRCAVAVVLASGGYPQSYRSGRTILGLDRLPTEVIAFHAGTRYGEDGQIETSGGRVLALTALGETFTEARDSVYAAVEHVTFADRQFRADIALREVHTG
ncbi:MAG TPA: phosphoribosylamine--glycine ligase [Nitrolancea sp.]|nr:phosphoribosylamine--glycine ligase [Nitrolancea sp.]